MPPKIYLRRILNLDLFSLVQIVNLCTGKILIIDKEGRWRPTVAAHRLNALRLFSNQEVATNSITNQCLVDGVVVSGHLVPLRPLWGIHIVALAHVQIAERERNELHVSSICPVFEGSIVARLLVVDQWCTSSIIKKLPLPKRALILERVFFVCIRHFIFVVPPRHALRFVRPSVRHSELHEFCARLHMMF